MLWEECRTPIFTRLIRLCFWHTWFQCPCGWHISGSKHFTWKSRSANNGIGGMYLLCKKAQGLTRCVLAVCRRTAVKWWQNWRKYPRVWGRSWATALRIARRAPEATITTAPSTESRLPPPSRRGTDRQSNTTPIRRSKRHDTWQHARKSRAGQMCVNVAPAGHVWVNLVC